MIKYAKASLPDIVKFKAAAVDLSDSSHFFLSGKSCIGEVINYLSVLKKQTNESMSHLEPAKERVEERLLEIEALISSLTARRDNLEANLESIQDELAFTSETITEIDEEGNSNEFPNPAYVELQEQYAEISEQLSDCNSELYDQQSRKEAAQSLSSRIASKIDEMNGVIYSLEEKTGDCHKFSADIESERESVLRRSSIAIANLSGIERAIERYSSIKMKLDRSLIMNPLDQDGGISIEKIINVSLSINQTRVDLRSPDPLSREEKANERNREVDDNGAVFRIGDKLVPNNTYQKNGYRYTTDNQGRKISASGTLTINLQGQENRKMTDKITVIGRGDERLEIDDRGHLIGHQFNGADDLSNLVAQDMQINRGSYRKLEDYLAGQVKDGRVVNVSVIPFYPSDSWRPDGIFYFYNIDGISSIVLFPNEALEA